MNLTQNIMTKDEAETLAKLDQVCLAGRAGRIETNYGEIEVHPTRFHGFCAEILDFENVKRIAFGAMPSIAFLKLASITKEIYG
jgi:hypothetical protein